MTPAKTREQQGRRLPGGRFAPGSSGNRSGRPNGSRNNATIASQALLDGQGEAITRKAVQMALAWESGALRLCMERLLPPVKDKPVRLKLPKVNSASEVVNALETVLTAVSRGELTPSEGAAVSGLLEMQRRALETSKFEVRLKTLEEANEKS